VVALPDIIRSKTHANRAEVAQHCPDFSGAWQQPVRLVSQGAGL
jgi:hypothetical protein